MERGQRTVGWRWGVFLENSKRKTQNGKTSRHGRHWEPGGWARGGMGGGGIGVWELVRMCDGGGAGIVGVAELLEKMETRT